jgi:hypothetical protein
MDEGGRDGLAGAELVASSRRKVPEPPRKLCPQPRNFQSGSVLSKAAGSNEQAVLAAAAHSSGKTAMRPFGTDQNAMELLRQALANLGFEFQIFGIVLQFRNWIRGEHAGLPPVEVAVRERLLPFSRRGTGCGQSAGKDGRSLKEKARAGRIVM